MSRLLRSNVSSRLIIVPSSISESKMTHFIHSSLRATKQSNAEQNCFSLAAKSFWKTRINCALPINHSHLTGVESVEIQPDLTD